MANSTSPQGLGLTPAKGAIIAVLAVVLVGVLYLQYSGEGDSELKNPPPYKPPTAARAASQATATAPKRQPEPVVYETKDTNPQLTTFDPTRWESPVLSRVIAFDPFARPSTFPQPQVVAIGEAEVTASSASAEERARELAEAVERLQKQLAQLQQRGVQVIVGDDQSGYVAVIGDRTVHVGDTIDGFVITAIEPDGVQVEQSEVE